jgi:ribonuclease-3
MSKSDDKIRSILKSLNIQVDDLKTYRTAFTHQSYSNEHNVENNERLEFLGDAILDFLVADYLYHKYPTESEGKLTKLRAKYVCEKANSEYAIELELNDAFLLGKGESEYGGKNKQSLLSDLFEAFLGAVYLENGIEKVNEILKKIIFPKIEHSTSFFIDYKSRLQEYFQAESRKTVEYQLIKETGPTHDKTFTMAVIHDNIRLGTGIGKSKKEAEQQAAKDALEKLATNK